MEAGVVYSPSQTEDFHICPMYWYLRHVEKWVPKTFGSFELAAALGQGIHAGLASVYETYSGTAASTSYHVEKATQAAQAYIQEMLDQGRKCRSKDVETMERVGDRVMKGMQKLIESPPLPYGWAVEAVEPEYPDHGNCRPDLLVRDPHRLATVDFKTRLTLPREGNKKSRILSGEDWWWKSQHYMWAADAQIRSCDATDEDSCWRHHIFIIVLEPKFEVHHAPLEGEPAVRHLWLESACESWADMQAIREGSRMAGINSQCRDWWTGGCKMGCREHGCHESAFRKEYIKL